MNSFYLHKLPFLLLSISLSGLLHSVPALCQVEDQAVFYTSTEAFFQEVAHPEPSAQEERFLKDMKYSGKDHFNMTRKWRVDKQKFKPTKERIWAAKMRDTLYFNLSFADQVQFMNLFLRFDMIGTISTVIIPEDGPFYLGNVDTYTGLGLIGDMVASGIKSSRSQFEDQNGRSYKVVYIDSTTELGAKEIYRWGSLLTVKKLRDLMVFHGLEPIAKDVKEVELEAVVDVFHQINRAQGSSFLEYAQPTEDPFLPEKVVKRTKSKGEGIWYLKQDLIRFTGATYCSFYAEGDAASDGSFQAVTQELPYLEPVISSISASFLEDIPGVVFQELLHDPAIRAGCQLPTPDFSWQAYLDAQSSVAPNLEEEALSMRVFARTTSIAVPLPPESKEALGESPGLIQYIVTTKWAVIMYDSNGEIYRGNSMAKDYFSQPKQAPFAYALSEETIESLMTLALEAFLERK